MGIMHLATAAALAAISLAPLSSAHAAEAPPGAASCSGCHPTQRWVDTGVPRLVARNPDELFAAMAAFKSGQREATVMDRIAKGFSDNEIKAIAAWYGAQKD